MPFIGQVFPDYSRKTNSAVEANNIEASPRVCESSDLQDKGVCESSDLQDKGVCEVCGLGDDCGFCDFCGSAGSQPPRMPLVLSRSNACMLDCGIDGPCESCVGNKQRRIEACVEKGYDICHDCMYFKDSCKCAKPIQIQMPTVLIRQDSCMPDCGGTNDPCVSCAVNKQRWIEACERQGYGICHECLYYKDFCKCEKTQQSGMPLVLCHTHACMPDCGLDGRPCVSCVGNKQRWIEACERKGYDICHECLCYTNSCMCVSE